MLCDDLGSQDTDQPVMLLSANHCCSCRLQFQVADLSMILYPLFQKMCYSTNIQTASSLEVPEKGRAAQAAYLIQLQLG